MSYDVGRSNMMINSDTGSEGVKTVMWLLLGKWYFLKISGEKDYMKPGMEWLRFDLGKSLV